MEKEQADSAGGNLHGMIQEIIGLASAPTDFDVITQIEQLQTLANAAQGAIARLSMEFDGSQRDEQRRMGMRGARVGRGVSDQLALARKQSPARASRELGLARALRDDLPYAADLLTRGVISAEVAQAVHRESTHLDGPQRRQVDHQLAGSMPEATPRSAAAAARKAAYAIDPSGAVDRAAKAAEDRAVWARPAPDTMCKVTALVPAAQGVSAYATLRRDAQAIIATGDPAGRTLAQVMADLLVERTTGQPTAADVPVEVQLVMTPGQLFGEDPVDAGPQQATDDSTAGPQAAADDPAVGPDGPIWLNGYGPLPAALARAVVAGVPDLLGVTPAGVDRAQAWVRRLFVDPTTGQLTGVDARRRAFDGTIRRFIRIRDQVCRIPFCDAPIRDVDHVHRHADGGPTDIENGAGVCQRFNQVKETPGWTTQVIHGDVGSHDQRAGPDRGVHPHTIRITTPTGKTYTSSSPPVHGTRASVPDTPEVIRVRFAQLLALAC